MNERDWIDKFCGSAEDRERKIRICSRIKTWGLVFILFTLLAMLWFIFFDMPEKPADAFILAVALSVCFAAGFSLMNSMEMEVKLLRIVGELKK